MLKRNLSKDRNLVLWNSKYYVVNDLTYVLLEAFDNKVDIDDISKKLGYKKVRFN